MSAYREWRAVAFAPPPDTALMEYAEYAHHPSRWARAVVLCRGAVWRGGRRLAAYVEVAEADVPGARAQLVAKFAAGDWFDVTTGGPDTESALPTQHRAPVVVQ